MDKPYKIYRYKLSLFDDGVVDIIARTDGDAELELGRQLDSLVKTESVEVHSLSRHSEIEMEVKDEQNRNY